MNSLYIQNYKGHRDKIEFKTQNRQITQRPQKDKKNS